MTTDPDPDYLISHTTSYAAASSTRRSAGPVTLLVRRLAWQRYPRVDLRYDADEDILLVRFDPLITAEERMIDDRLYVGRDSTGNDAHCTTVCLAGFTSDASDRVPYEARLVLGERVWSRAITLASQGSGDDTLVLDRPEAPALMHSWSALFHEGAPTSDTPFKVNVIPVSDSQLQEVLAQWSAEIAKVDQTRTGHRGLLPSALHRGIRERDIRTPEATVGGEWERPDLAEIGVHPRLAWQVEPGDPPVLVIKAAPILPDPEVRPDIGRRIEVQLGDRLAARAAFESDEVGAFAARVPLPVDAALRRLLHPTGYRRHHVSMRYAAKRGRRLLIRGVRKARRVAPHWARSS